jgi:hypothetical protein
VLERVVEDWLTNVNELGYEESFAHVLLAEGHHIIHRQQHGELELGKDIFTRDSNGTYHCFQLKGGDIRQKKWESIEGQLNLTVTSPIIHPNVSLGTNFTPHLVTNGIISDPVRVDIFARNLIWEKQYGRQLNLILYDQLLEKFLALQSSFLPAKPRDFQLFLTLYLADKREPLNCAQFSTFLLSVLPDATMLQAEIQRLFAAVIIIADYVISGYEAIGNNYAAAQAWCLLTFHLLRFCEQHRETKDWHDSIALLVESIDRCTAKVVTEAIKSVNWMEGNPIVDEKVWHYRLSSLVGLMSAHMISHRMRLAKLSDEDEVYARIGRGAADLKLWGEYAAPAVFLAAQCLCARGAERAGIEVAMGAIRAITEKNRRGQAVGIPDPYFDCEEVVRSEVLRQDVYGDKVTFAGRSFALRQFVEFLVRRNWPNTLRKNWFNIADIDYVEFSPELEPDSYLWSNGRGSTNGRRWAHPQRWCDLIEESLTEINDPLLIDGQFAFLLPHFFLFMPHRFTPKRARQLDIRVLLSQTG